MLTDQELSQGGYRFEDLLELRIVSGRTDLERKQKQLGFPKPVKTGDRQAWFPKAEVHDWLRARLALRDQPTEAPPFVKHKPHAKVAERNAKVGVSSTDSECVPVDGAQGHSIGRRAPPPRTKRRAITEA
jgi:hypothetical protein